MIVRDPLTKKSGGSSALTRAIIDTIDEPLIVLDEDLRVLTASRSFYRVFGTQYESVQGNKFYHLGDGEWDVPALRLLLEEVLPQKKTVENYQITHHFRRIGERVMLVSAREILNQNGAKKILLSIRDITRQRFLEDSLNKLVAQKNILLREMSHRIANSLQLIAGVLLLKASSVDSDEAQYHLTDVHNRILSIAEVQRQLDPADMGDSIDIDKYLKALCLSIANSVIREQKPISLTVQSSGGMITSEQALNFGLVTTELVINALKHAFPHHKGEIVVSYTAKDDTWKLAVADNGIGFIQDENMKKEGLGASIVDALAKQLGADLSTISTTEGTTVSLTHV